MRRARAQDPMAERRRRFHRHVKIACWAGIAVWALLMALYFAVFNGGLSEEPTHWGVFGDYLGGVLNPLLAFASFLILLITLYEQRLHLAEERREQNVQQVRAWFLELVHRVADVGGGVRYETAEGREVTGREAFRCMFVFGMKQPYEQSDGSGDAPDLARYIMLSKQLYSAWHHELGVYFRTLYHLCNFIDGSELSLEDKTRLVNFARAQLSSYELSILFYYCLWGEGRATLRPFVEKYGLFKYLSAASVLSARDLEPGALYPEAAFAGFTRRVALWQGKEPAIEPE